MTDTTSDERIDDVEIKLAYQEKLISELDALVRALGARLDDALREVRELKAALGSPEVPLGPATEKPPHY